jgi:hypothetical protein
MLWKKPEIKSSRKFPTLKVTLMVTLNNIRYGRTAMALTVNDNGGRRLGIERRQFSYLLHIPEQRSGKDRRKAIDRRSGRGVKLEDRKEQRKIFRD